MSLPFWLRIFLPDGDPDGIKIIEKSNWTGRGLVFPRPLIGEAKSRPELDEPGVYVLIGPGEQTQLQRVYVGESDQVRQRLVQHVANKDFWTHAVVFTGKVNKAHVQHLETRLLGLAASAKRCELDNSNVPNIAALSEVDRAQAEAFLADMLLCFPILGMSFFEVSGAGSPKVSSEDLRLMKGNEIEARGLETPQGFVVRKDSRATKTEWGTIPAYVVNLRKDLLACQSPRPLGHPVAIKL